MGHNVALGCRQPLARPPSQAQSCAGTTNATPSYPSRSYSMAITKDQLIGDIAEAIDTPKTTVRSALDQLSEIVTEALENGGEITLPGIGKLKVSERPARTGRNPQTGKAIEIAAKKVVKFVPAKALTDAVN
ncbi:HU family DNA-binding protein [Phytopseudomonas daroniae]|uniref:HU family DNA-binding protein n=1 Tax=Phytopseudomonas daroniae TaxID=2487519 RepID=UPI002448C0D9|nr:HU family DNA-binding protein [Pseudomonas daroniae]